MEISKVCKSESYLENFSNMLSRNDPRNNVLCKRSQTEKAVFKIIENYLEYTLQKSVLGKAKHMKYATLKTPFQKHPKQNLFLLTRRRYLANKQR